MPGCCLIYYISIRVIPVAGRLFGVGFYIVLVFIGLGLFGIPVHARWDGRDWVMLELVVYLRAFTFNIPGRSGVFFAQKFFGKSGSFLRQLVNNIPADTGKFALEFST